MTLPDHIDPIWAAWFSGFIDGEGYFQLMPQGENGRFSARLVIQVREDDAPLLDEIQETLRCGSVYSVSKGYDRDKGRKSADQGMWVVFRIDEIMSVIVPLFEEFPLRSKKIEDFRVWREAADLISRGANDSPTGRKRLKSLKTTLVEQRKYRKMKDEEEATVEESDESKEHQFSLFDEET